jgi:hypothetical protein
VKASILILTAALAAATAMAQPNPPDDATQKKIIADARAKALAYANELPDFVCRQVTRRNEDPKGTNQWRTMDTVNEQLTFVNHKEEYRTISVNGKKAGDRSNQILRSTDFIDPLLWIFDPKYKAEISWSSWDALRGHRVHVLGFRVTKENSPYVLKGPKNQQATIGFFGVVNVDSESGAILKVGIIATDIPTTFPVQGVANELNYEFAKIGDHYFVVPLKADLHSKEGKMLIWNEVEFHDFAKPPAQTAAK